MSMLLSCCPDQDRYRGHLYPAEAASEHHRYRIVVSGRLGQARAKYSKNLSLEFDGANTGLTGELVDPALYGVLNRIPEFGLELVAIEPPG